MSLIIRPGTQWQDIQKLDDVPNLAQYRKIDVAELYREVKLDGIEKALQVDELIFAKCHLVNVLAFKNCMLTKLQELYISYNKLTSLDGIESLTNLVELGVHVNQLANPLVLQPLIHLKQLNRLIISENPFTKCFENEFITDTITNSAKVHLIGCVLMFVQPNARRIFMTAQQQSYVKLKENNQICLDFVQDNFALDKLKVVARKQITLAHQFSHIRIGKYIRIKQIMQYIQILYSSIVNCMEAAII